MSWLTRLLRRDQLEQQLDKELKFHIDAHTAELISRGVDPATALRQARMAVGGPEQVKEECRDARGTRWLEDFAQDIRHTLRTMRTQAGFVAVALLTISLGVGAVTAMFTVVNAVLLKPLPYLEPQRLVNVQEQTDQPTQLGSLWAFSYPNFRDCQRASRTLELAAWDWGGGTVSSGGSAEYADGREISAGFFSVLGVRMYRGREFLPAEDNPGGAPVAILGYSFWQRLSQGNDDAIGRQVSLNGKLYTVAGIAPANFQLAGPVDILTPLGQNDSPRFQSRAAHQLSAVARIRAGATRAQAHAELEIIGRQLAWQFPDTNLGRTFVEQPLREELVGSVRSTLLLLLGAVTLVLLIACVNVASLLLSRSIFREREFAMRVALGAGRGRLIRQCLTESVVLALFGGVGGIAIAWAGSDSFVKLWPGDLPRANEIYVDWRVLLFAAGVSVVSGIVFGMAPALRVPKRNVEQTLRSGAKTIAVASKRLHGALVIAEIALAVVLLVSAGILGRALLRFASLDPGINPHNVLIARMALSPAVLADPAKTRAEWQDVLDRVRSVPGVDSVATVDTVPMRAGINELGYWTTPYIPPVNEVPLALATSVTPDYLKVMGIRLRAGRFFDEHDHLGSQLVIVIDEVMARRVFGTPAAAVGKPITVAGMGDAPVLIVGVVGHVRHWGLAGDDQAPVRDQIYYPFAQVPDGLVRRWSELMSIAVRTSGAPLSVIDPLRRFLRGPGGDQVLYQAHTMDELAGASIARQRFLLVLFGTFAGLALLLACVGIYGVLAYLTKQRTPEIGVRMALGAATGDVLRMVLRQSLLMILGGVAAGTIGAIAAARLLERLVEGVTLTSALTYASMLALLIAAALLASFLPARRASRIDPLTALRQE